MAELSAWGAIGLGLATTLLLATAVWLLSLPLRNVSIVDSAWSVLIVGAALPAALLRTTPLPGPAIAALALALLWAVRLAGYITWRNAGHGEDRRYQEIRQRNQPHFEWKSLYLVFWLQAVLATVVALPLIGLLSAPQPWTPGAWAGAALAAFGLVFEAVADTQLARFKADAAHRGQVMDTGLWRYTRHPNYFGEFCLWWGLGAMALAGGSWWALASPLLMSFLLLKVSGVTLLEKDIGERRPGYREYVARTNAFFPGPHRK